jgi:predicted acyl esterase
MVNGWMGDDWFHYGAFRQPNFDYFTFMMTDRKEGDPAIRDSYGEYEMFRRVGSAGDFAKRTGIDQLPWWQRLSAHPAYDDFWQGQALDRLIVRRSLKVPTTWIQGLWDHSRPTGESISQ